MFKIILSSENLDLCKNLEFLLSVKNDFQSFDCSVDLDDICSILDLESISVLLIDISLDCQTGFSYIELLSQKYPQLKIIAVTNSSEPNLVLQSISSGARAVLYDESVFNEINRCIFTILQGDYYLPCSFITKTLSAYKSSEKCENLFSSILSQREIEHIEHIANGFSSKEIAHKLNISQKTADNYKTRIMSKLQLKSVADIVKFAIREKIIVL